MVSSLSGGANGSDACNTWEARLRAARALLRATHHAQRRLVTTIHLILTQRANFTPIKFLIKMYILLSEMLFISRRYLIALNVWLSNQFILYFLAVLRLWESHDKIRLHFIASCSSRKRLTHSLHLRLLFKTFDKIMPAVDTRESIGTHINISVWI